MLGYPVNWPRPYISNYLFVPDSLWLHVRATGHWTRRVYDLFRAKLQQEHGMAFDDNSNIDLRTSMRMRMSKSYIDGLRGSNPQDIKPQIETNNNETTIRSSQQTNNPVKSTFSSLSLPQVKFQKKLKPSCQSAINIRDRTDLHSRKKLILPVIHADDIEEETTTILPSNKNSTQLTVPSEGECCIRMSNTPSISDEQQEFEFNDTRLSDVLGYLRMYQNQNRIQFNSLEFNDREDLQVRLT